MKNNKSDWTGTFLTVFFICIFTILVFVCGYSAGIKITRKEAFDQGVGLYQAEPSSGKPKWVWKKVN